ncbi:hypothetical protein EW145_g5200 [Phellinidium pouzarii]|uniref:Magnesium transporter n=1 Tax=Phellinidium pouzarii TaxID=167371 RepID=A0A4S4L113_9AGAM|nr:hypothetical protein EW145_g5200 [Phellinidium pouzarii]
MVRENSFSDSDGRSLTPDLDEEMEHNFIGPPEPIAASPVEDNTTGGQFDLPPAKLPTKSTSTSPSFVFQERTEKPGQAMSASSIELTAIKPARSGSSDTVPKRPGLAVERFRNSVRKIIHMNRGSSALSLGGIGAEPGIDPRRSSAYLNYGHLRQKCTVEIVDYSSVRASFGRMENKGFIEFMDDPKASKREPWVKVRWINVGGVSWDVISSLALRHDMHPLALEDVLHQRTKQARSKADYYMQHLFIRVLRHTLVPNNDDESPLETIVPSITHLPRSSSPDSADGGMSDDEGVKNCGSGEPDEEQTLSGSKFLTKRKTGSLGKTMSYAMADLENGEEDRQRGRMPTSMSMHLRRKREAEAKTIEKLKRGDRVNVKTMPFFIFLFRDGTVISINQSPDISFVAPISARLRQRDTGLRATADPSLLVQIVDEALEVVDEFQTKIFKLEREVLIKPKMKTVRFLHIMSGDLTLHKRTLEPIKTLVYGLRRYDVDRCAALVTSSGGDAANTKIQGFMSHKSKIYLADVHDHIDYIISSIDMFSGVSENLINFTFNMASYEMNEVMRRLTMATIIFLPLTLLTGYFGMNFQPFWAVNNNSDALFWKIAVPVMVVVAPLFLWPDFERMYYYCMKRWSAYKSKKALKRSAKKKQ